MPSTAWSIRTHYPARSGSEAKVKATFRFVQFDLPEASAEEFMRHAFSRISVRLVTQPVAHLLLNHPM
jgi:hypothetical protein